MKVLKGSRLSWLQIAPFRETFEHTDRDHGCTLLEDPSWAHLCLVDPGRNCPLSTDLNWAYWHQNPPHNHYMWKCKPGGSSLPLSSVSHLGTGLDWGCGVGASRSTCMQDGVPAFVQHILKRRFLLTSSGAMSVFLWRISGHWEIIF